MCIFLSLRPQQQYSILDELDIHQLLSELTSKPFLLVLGESQSAFPTQMISFTIQCPDSTHASAKRPLASCRNPQANRPLPKVMPMVIFSAQLSLNQPNFLPRRMCRPTPLWRLEASSRECLPPWPEPVPCPESAQDQE